MALTLTLAACNTNPALNGPDGAVDLPSTIDDQLRLILSFCAQLRDGVAAGTPMWHRGMIAQFPAAAAPTGWLTLNGQLVSRTTYADLFAVATALGLQSEASWAANNWGFFSVGDGSTTFRLPDLRGMHTRGADQSRGMDPGRAIGTFQDHALLAHAHGINDPAHAHAVADPGHAHGAFSDSQGGHVHEVQNFVFNDFPSGFGFPAIAGNLGIGNKNTSGNGVHAHNITVNAAGTGISIYASGTGISIQSNGGAQNLVRNVAYPYFIKY